MPMIICKQFAHSQVYTAYRKLETALYRHAHVQGRHPSPLGRNDPVTSTPSVLSQKTPLAPVTSKRQKSKWDNMCSTAQAILHIERTLT